MFVITRNIFYVLAIIATVPALVSPYFPAIDSPSHLEIANTLYHLFFDPHEIFSHYYRLNISLVNTNWLFYILPTLLIKVLPVYLVEKVILFFYFIAFFLVAIYLSNLTSRRNISGFLLIPLVYNFALHGGFYSFLFGLIASFFAIAYYLHHEEKLKAKDYIFLFFLFNLIYLAHPFTFAMTIGVLFTYAASSGVIHLCTKTRCSLRISLQFIAKKADFLLCGLPGIICLILTASNSEGGELNRESFIQLIRILTGFHFLWSYSSLEILLSRVLLLFVLIISVYILFRKTSVEKHDGLIFSFLCCTFLYFISPESLAGGGSINIRISAYLYFLLIVWLGYQDYSQKLAYLTKYFCLFIFAIFLIFNSVKSVQISNLIEEYVSVSPYIQENSTIASFDFIDRGLNLEDRVITNRRGIGQVTGYIAASRNSINLNNYQATRDNFPIKFRAEVYPRTWLFSQPPKIADYNLETNGEIDYVLLWGASQAEDSRNLDQIKAQLKDEYRLVYTSSRGLAELYEINSRTLQTSDRSHS